MAEFAETSDSCLATPHLSSPPKDHRTCRYFNRVGGCREGNLCRFRHITKEKESPSETSVVPNSSGPGRPQGRAPFIPKKIVLKESDRGSIKQKEAKAAELGYFKRRYRYVLITEKEEEANISFYYFITEPDWVFEVKKIAIQITLPPDYPIASPEVNFEKNNQLPDVLRNYIKRTTGTAIEAKYKGFANNDSYEIIGKSLIHWIDKNILALFVEGLRQQKLVFEAESSGITLVNKKPVAPVSRSEHLLEDKTEEHDDNNEKSEEDINAESSGEEEAEIVSSPTADGLKEPIQEYPVQLSIIWKDESQNIASITAVSLFLLVRCVRCREEKSAELRATGFRVWRCDKCALVHCVRTKAELIHENNSVLARIEARGCQPVDLILLDTALKFVCLACNKEDDVQKINYGLTHKSFCKNCHHRCEFFITVARFSGDFAKCNLPANPSSSLPKPSKPKNTPIGPVITPGQPLPKNGTCKHYGKSYRWFRFPCCGRAFPCDKCHEEANLGHEMKVANRMICGHCSSEQPFVANKPCSHCQEDVTRSRSRFWEGGKGCRDQKVMSRNDVHKHKDRAKKTVPNKLVAKKKPDTN